MIPTLAAFLHTITGKVAIGVTVATASVGAAAAGAPVPIVQELVPGHENSAVGSPDEDENEEDELAATVDRSGDEGDENNGDEGDANDGGEGDDDESSAELVAAAQELDEGGDEVEEGDDANHGEIVSTFATTTELEGCERGQAVSAVARGILDPESPEFDAELTAYVDGLDDLGKCQNTDEDEAEGEEEADDADEAEAGEANHGEIVSTFATTTELEGCERGQAVSAVARGILDPESPEFDAELTAYVDGLDDLGKCQNTDEDEAEGEIAPEDETDDGERRGPKTDKSDKSGKSGEKGNRPAHAGNGKP